jgi:hypothetical protein
MGRDPLGEVSVLGRLDATNPGAEDGDGTAVGDETGLVRRGVDAASETGEHRHPTGGEQAGQLPGAGQALRLGRRVPRIAPGRGSGHRPAGCARPFVRGGMGWRAPLRSLARAGPWRPGGVEKEIWTLAPPAGATGHDRPSAERAVAPARLRRDALAAGRRGHPAARVSAIAEEMAFSALTGAHAPGPVVVQVGHGGRSCGSSRHAHPARSARQRRSPAAGAEPAARPHGWDRGLDRLPLGIGTVGGRSTSAGHVATPVPRPAPPQELPQPGLLARPREPAPPRRPIHPSAVGRSGVRFGYDRGRWTQVGLRAES